MRELFYSRSLDFQALWQSSRRAFYFINILNYAIEKTGQKHIHTIMGGTYLRPASREVRGKSIQALRQFDIERIGVSHCSGLEASMQVFQEFGEILFFFKNEIYIQSSKDDKI